MSFKALANEVYKARSVPLYYVIIRRTKLNLTCLIVREDLDSGQVTSDKVSIISRDQFNKLDLIKSDKSLGLNWQ